MHCITKILILLIKICVATGAMFVKEETFLKIENGEQLVGKTVPFGKTINEQYCTMKCTSVDACTGVSYNGEECTGIITFGYPDEGVVIIATLANLLYKKYAGPPEMCIHFEDLSQMTLNGAAAEAGYVGQGLGFTAIADGSTGQTVDAGIWKGKACFVTPQSCRNGFTLSFWAKIHNLSQDKGGFLTTIDTSTQGINIRRVAISLRFCIRLESAHVCVNGDYAEHWNKWTHIAVSMAERLQWDFSR